MSTDTWNGSNADWTTNSDWSGGSAPGATDTADISSGTVDVSSNDDINAGSLNLTGGSLTVEGELNLTSANAGNGYIPTVNISGGVLTVNGGSLEFGTYLNSASGTVVVTNFGSVQWNGTSPNLVDGTIGSTAGTTIDLQSGQFQIEKPFDGQIADFGGNDLLSFNGQITSSSYSNNVLSVQTNTGTSYSVRFVGHYQANKFAVSTDGSYITYNANVDTTPPAISSITLDKATYGLNDTVTATIQLSGANDGNGAYTLGQGSTIDGAALTAGTYNATNNTLTASFVISAATTEVIAGNVPVNVTVDDAAANASTADTTGVPNKTIDTHAPTAVSVAGFTNGTTDTGKAPVAAGSTVGALSTTDVSPNDSFTYALGGNDAGRFAISNGVLDVGSTALTDGVTYDLTVTSTDLGGNRYAQAVQVTGATTPTVTSIVPAGPSPTNTSLDPFTVTFSQAVTGVQASSFTLSGTDGTGTIGTPTSTDGVTYTVPVTGVSGNGTLGLALTSTTGIVSTSTGTALGGTRMSDSDYTIDTTLSTPTIAFVASNSAAGAADVNAAHASSAGYTVGSVDMDATATVLFTGTLKSTGASGTVAGDGTNGSHTVDLSVFRDGTVTAAISDQDGAGNARMGGNAMTTLDTTAPTIAINAPIAGDNTINVAEAAQGVIISGTTTAENGQTVTVQIRNASGAAVDTYSVATLGGNYNAAVTAAQAQALADGSYTVAADVSDLAGNPAPEATQALTVNETAPAAPSITLSDDTGVSITDKVTSDPTLTVTPSESGGTLLYSIDGGPTYTTTAPTFATDGSADGQHTVDVEQRDAAGNTSTPGSLTFTLDTTPPNITAVIETGNGIGANGNGEVPAGTVVTFTVQTDGPVTVTQAADGSTPTLTLNDGGTATYTGPTGTATSTLTFTTMVAAGQNTSALAVTAVNANGTTVTDAAGNPINPSLMGAAVPSGTLVIDTTAPVASSPTLTVAQNAAATPIGIAAPSDNLTAAGSLAIVAGSLPTDGTVTLADGTTPVTAGQSLTAAQLTGLEFTPTPGISNRGSTFTYTVTDGAGNASQGTAALNVGAAGAPAITGTHVTIDGSEAAVAPFTGVTVSDPNMGTDTLTITLQNGGGTLAGTGLVSNPNGTYTLAGSVATVTQQLDALSFTPTAPPPGTSATTTFVLSDVTSAGTSVTDVGTSVTDTASAAPPPPPAPPSPDAVSIDPTVTYKNRVFTLTGTASSASGVSSVEISADVDGTRQDLGAATVNANGTFAFSDAVGDQQTFFVATLTDGAGGQAMSADPGFNLTGGLGPTGGIGKAEDFDATGQVSTTLYRSNGSRTVGIDAPGQTVDLQPFDVVGNHHEAGTSFVFNRGDGLDVVHGFKVGGAGHDTIDLPSSDFTNLADVLRHTGDVQGSAFITDPKTGDAIRLAGVSTAELKAHPKDIAFHA